MSDSWTINDSNKLYQIEGWGEPYFAINEEGNITVSPRGNDYKIDLFNLVESLKKRDIHLPLLIRFSDMLDDRLKRLHECMNEAISRYNYKNVYRGVFPVKCNQHRQLVEAIVEYGKPYKFGLEVGSKPELMIALATLDIDKTGETLLICNGYKDEDYLETALLAQQLGHNLIIVIEQISELFIILKLSKKLQLKPQLGVRAKLQSKGSGHWGNSTGEKAKFGLTIPEIVTVINKLKNDHKLDCLQLLHFHIGSQISSIAVIKDAIREASQIYVQLSKMGAGMKYLDVGGGLAVDYDGSKTNFYASKNYNMQNYANDIVAAIQEACDENAILPPILVSESGRAIASHQSVLIFNVVSSNNPPLEVPEKSVEKEHLIIRNLWETYNSIDAENYQEMYHDAVQFKEEAISLFNFGYLNLSERAKAEKLYWGCCHKIYEITKNQTYVSDDLNELNDLMIATYYMNLSVFQSAPDAWAIDQLFPVLPIHRLNEKPTMKAILADLTCDSDGKIDKFIDLLDVKNYLELHTLEAQENININNSENTDFKPYYLGMFLVGAYQEIMGNLHNLFGDINVVHIESKEDNYIIKYVVKGDTVTEVLQYLEYSAEDLREKLRCLTEKALKENQIDLEKSQLLIKNYDENLRSYTYLS
ncbi:MAG: biosynthetic arginine decarboxylase [Cyanobacteria bacterium]|nr:biosynthetic arginine decarboxylase [Cyanobacteria bacterium CG_2015-16_32_12]NCO78998.1 biosynthetic arginine decarboxylase [Cyanobacteria bacterium CG_2015-22_32_23]NCQ42237.1 biosynthetic arginine decarboxylase [Cyanobacteria bacterium CG_2015-04_32_10]NCS85207.1 biosynthetic arginine decarboxylase [Cyanobacteria bacterium CG_2015-02_32_10]